MKPDSALAWHYTVGARLVAILESESLKPATAGIGAGERPVVWFSLNQTFEPTAAKGIVDARTGERRTATIDEMEQIGGGLFRFGIEPRKLLNHDRLRRAARINSETWRALVAAARRFGSDPNDWFGHVGAISIYELVLQRREDRIWVNVMNDEEAGEIT